MDGTSMAAPHVSGAAAILMARYPELIGRPDFIKQVLMKTATDLGRERDFQGAGLLDIPRAAVSLATRRTLLVDKRADPLNFRISLRRKLYVVLLKCRRIDALLVGSISGRPRRLVAVALRSASKSEVHLDRRRANAERLSRRNQAAAKTFFKKVPAKHYVVSANGKFDNPDLSTLQMIKVGREDSDDFTIHLTNHWGQNNLQEILDEFFDVRELRGRSYKVKFRNDAGDDAPSIRVDLLEEVDF
jgi:hypothetical protein